MNDLKFMKIYGKYFSQDLTDHYDLYDRIDNDGYDCHWINKGIYEFKYAARLAIKSSLVCLEKNSMDSNFTGIMSKDTWMFQCQFFSKKLKKKIDLQANT